MPSKIKANIYAYVLTLVLGTLFKIIFITATGIVLWLCRIPQSVLNLILPSLIGDFVVGGLYAYFHSNRAQTG